MVWLKRWCGMMNDAAMAMAMAMAVAAKDDEGECQDAFIYRGVFQWLLTMQSCQVGGRSVSRAAAWCYRYSVQITAGGSKLRVTGNW